MKSIFVRNIYEECENKYDSKNLKLIRQEIITERNLDCPALEVHNTIHDKELNKDFFIHKVQRNTDNTYIYVVEEEFEHTMESLKKELKESENRYDEFKKKYDSLWSECSKLEWDFKKLQTTNKEIEAKLNTKKSLFARIFS
jgi:predicted RNase H-like nuclease (RuvC/YqgF family)